MFKLMKYVKKYYLYIIIIFILVISQVFLDLQLPNNISNIFNLAIKKDINELLLLIFKLLIFVILSAILTLISNYFSTKMSAKLSKDIRNDLFKKVNSLSLEDVDKLHTSSLITRTTNDVNQVGQAIIMLFTQGLRAPIMSVSAILLVSNVDIVIALIVGIVVLFLLIFLIIIFKMVIPKFKLIQKAFDDLNQVSSENLKGIRVIRAFNSEKYQEERFMKKNENVKKISLNIFKKMNLMNPVMTFLQNGLTLVILLYSTVLLINNEITAEIPTSLMQFSMQIFFAFFNLIIIFMMIPRASISAKRIIEVLDMDIKIKDKDITLNTDFNNVDLEFNNVSFKYDDAEEDVLKDISFKATTNQTIAIIGSTGSGKSTLINLIPRFYDVTNGQILINNIDIRNLKIKDLRKNIGYISQKGILFKGSIKSNLDFLNENKSDDDLNKALEIAQAKDFVDKLENKLDYEIAQRGTNVSGGQKQRLSIARALLKDPKIIIFDDSFSALDFKTDKNLRESLKENFKDKLIFIVGQRIGSIMDSDLIIVLEDGKIVGKGKHKDLLKNCEVYKEIAYSQLSKEELE